MNNGGFLKQCLYERIVRLKEVWCDISTLFVRL